MIRRLTMAVAAVVAALLASFAPAHADEAGTQAVQAGQSEEASLYQQALEALAEGRRTDASRALERLIERAPTHAGAWLDLALIQCSLGNSDEAERMFAVIETRFQPTRDILALIAETREAGCLPWTPNRVLTLTVGRGIDQNVNQGASTSALVLDGGAIVLPLLPDFLPRRDDYSIAGIDYIRELTPNGSLGFVQFQARHNDRIHEYDSNSVVAGISAPWRFGRWAVNTTGSLGAVMLGDRYYQRQAQLQARVTMPLPLPASMLFSVVGGATRNEFLTLTNFNSNTYELRGLFTYRKDSLFGSATVGYQDDEASAARPGGSREGWYGNLLLRRPLAGPVNGELGYTIQTWRSASFYSPGLIDIARRQSTQVLRANLSWPLANNQSLQLEGRVVRNRENISIFQYNNRQLQLSWQWQY